MFGRITYISRPNVMSILVSPSIFGNQSSFLVDCFGIFVMILGSKGWCSGESDSSPTNVAQVQNPASKPCVG